MFSEFAGVFFNLQVFSEYACVFGRCIAHVVNSMQVFSEFAGVFLNLQVLWCLHVL